MQTASCLGNNLNFIQIISPALKINSAL
uniref:Uncharacterized protein n=1 Tax=Anguilla anguilla TaxID=7936 RepID=A0A0E9VRC7_ANGAN